MKEQEITPEEKERRKKFLEWAENYEKVKAEGFAGVLPNGNLVDRREHPEAIPIAYNPMFNIPYPKPLPNEK